MWTSLCTFLSHKFFYKSEINSPRNNENNNHLYRKRLKLNHQYSDADDLLTETNSSSLFSMQKEIAKESDEEDECCVIAEIPRRKKPMSSLNIFETLDSVPLKECKESDLLLPECQKEIISVEDKKIENVNKNQPAKSYIKSHKFFTTCRTPLSQSKMVKSKSSLKSHLKKNINLLQESYRLTEKYQYMQLLQKHTTYNFLTFNQPFKRAILPKIESKEIPIIDLTDDNLHTEKAKNLALTDVNDQTPDQDIQIVGEVTKVRSFQDMLKIREVNSKESVERILSRHSKNCPEILDLSIVESNTINLLDDEDDNQKIHPEDLEEKLRTFMQITCPKTLQNCQGDKAAEEYILPELTYQQKKKIDAALILEPCDEILVEDFGLQITRLDMQTLCGLNWLNDEVINFYMNLIMERSKQNKALPKVFAFNTFFYPKLVSNGYLSLKRWTKQVDVFSYDIILVPIHLGMHWCMSVIDFRRKSVQYFDSVGSPNDPCLQRLLLYLKAESLDKKNQIFFTNDWEKSNVKDIPQQMNGSDCGVFSCMFAEHLARDCGIFFSQSDMPYFRKKMIIEILEKKLLT